MTCGPTGKQALVNPAGKLGAGHDVIMIAEVIALQPMYVLVG
tara:strand:- start:840 stop:965 length:126 start_codon:yes stop_codon:yes gene_type:complete